MGSLIEWLKGLWAKTGIWVKVVGAAILTLLGYIAVLKLKNSSLKAKAEDLEVENAVKTVEVNVSRLEGQKDMNTARIEELQEESKQVSGELATERQASSARTEEIKNLSNVAVLDEFRKKGY